MSRRFEKSLQKRATIVRRQRIAMICAGIFLIMFGIACLSDGSHTVKAGNNNHKYFTHVLVEEGDTLWDIAKLYITSEYASIDDYIYEVEQINHIDADMIIEGCYIMVPYYAEAPATQKDYHE